ncbi:MAG: lysophospholipid acyltransferase family protein [Beijerinckiaceae bacterium]
MLKKLLRSRFVLHGAGAALAGYLKLVRRTGNMVVEPAEGQATLDADWPYIVAMWHGQHFMIPFARRPQDRFSTMISRHGDGEINAAAVSHFGIGAVRGSGAQRQDQVRKRGGAQALRAALAALAEGQSLSMTADVPKVSRVAGKGIVVLAQLSGRPIVPVALVSSRRFDFESWDRSSIGLPFGRLAFVLGEPIRIVRHADAMAQEEARLLVEDGLDAVHARAYALVGAKDPGAGRESVATARAAARSHALADTA